MVLVVVSRVLSSVFGRRVYFVGQLGRKGRMNFFRQRHFLDKNNRHFIIVVGKN